MYKLLSILPKQFHQLLPPTVAAKYKFSTAIRTYSNLAKSSALQKRFTRHLNTKQVSKRLFFL